MEQTECGLRAGDKVTIILPKDEWEGLVGTVDRIHSPRTVDVRIGAKRSDRRLYYCVAALQKCA